MLSKSFLKFSFYRYFSVHFFSGRELGKKNRELYNHRKSRPETQLKTMKDFVLDDILSFIGSTGETQGRDVKNASLELEIQKY